MGDDAVTLLMDDGSTPFEQMQEDIREIARVLLKEHPPGTAMQEVWTVALSLYRVRFETEVLLPPPPERLPGRHE